MAVILAGDGIELESLTAPNRLLIHALAGGEGTSFPGTPSLDDKFYRTDRNLHYFYDGTRWLTTTLYAQPLAAQRQLLPTTSSPSFINAPVWTDDYDQWLVDMRASVYITTTNSGSAYWTLTLTSEDGATGTDIGSVNTSSLSPNLRSRLKLAVGALLGTAADGLNVKATKTGSPGSLYFEAMVTYRLVG